MNVRELIELLKEFNPEAVVYASVPTAEWSLEEREFDLWKVSSLGIGQAQGMPPHVELECDL